METTDEKFVVTKYVRINAEPAKVWEALTDPEKTKEYFFNCRVYSDWKEGSTITFKGKIFLVKNIEMSGRILKIEPGKLLKYNLKNGDESTSVVTNQLSYSNGVTTVSITDDVGQEEGAEKRFARSEKGWDKILEGLKKTVEEE